MTDTRMQPKQKNKFHRECRFVFLYFWVFLLDFGFFGILDFWFFGFYTAKPKMKNKQNTKNNRNTINNKTVPAFSVNLWFFGFGSRCGSGQTKSGLKLDTSGKAQIRRWGAVFYRGWSVMRGGGG